MRHEVTDADTATAAGSGDVPVLSTPRLIAWMEAETVHAAAAFTAAGQTTVGTALRIEHVHATPVGGKVDVFAEPPPSPRGRRLTFRVGALDDAGRLVATGEIDRAVVDRERFLAAALDPGQPGEPH
ncbi:thioesterase family protein [Actinacidiphila sp. bgisy160]|uniref:thioesterase family protein n=1 Tax=Actinacidiphila sp. bgisy160 TaxID=3413796 RepID=UPI003D76107F